MNTPTTLRALIDERARQFPDKPFLLGPAEDGGIDVLTFGQLRDACGTLAARFTDAGLNPGDVISVYMGNGLQTATLLLAAMYGGYVANPMNLLCQPSQVRYIVEHSDTRAIFVSRDSRESIDAALAELRAQGFERELRVIETHPDTVAHAQPAFAGEGAEAERPRLEQSNVTLLMYTSGTTGAPKGVLLTHRNLLANARNITAEHRLGSDDRVLASLPLYHINGLVVTLIAPLFHGGSVVMAARFSARTFWRDVARHRCTWINVVPTIVAYLLDRDERDPHDTFDLAALGGAAGRASPRVRGALSRRRDRDDGHDGNRRARLQQPLRHGAAPHREHRVAVGRRGARDRYRGPRLRAQ
jgi:long-chain acyl-CoA synthetase